MQRRAKRVKEMKMQKGEKDRTEKHVQAVQKRCRWKCADKGGECVGKVNEAVQ